MGPVPDEVLRHYAMVDEGARITSGLGQLEFLRVQEIVRRFLPAGALAIADIGSATGVHAAWLAEDGHRVHLIAERQRRLTAWSNYSRHMAAAMYDRLGVGYVHGRQPDPRWQSAFEHALGAAHTIVNVGAGTGSYEPSGRQVLAVEPSRVMVEQRPAAAAPVVRAAAEALPFSDGRFDVAMAVSTLHHWSDWAAGIREMSRVASRLVVVHFDPAVHDDFWLVRDYLPELSDVWQATPTPLDVADVMGPDTRISPLLVPADCRDGFLSAYWRRPSFYLDPAVRRCMSGLLALDPAVVERGTAALRADLESGRWHAGQADLLEDDQFDGGWRLLFTP